MKLQLDLQRATTLTPPSRPTLRRWLLRALTPHRDRAQLTLRLVDEAESAELNQQYRGKPGPTNVLAFPSPLPEGVQADFLGDLVICAPVVEREACEQGKSPRAHWAHIVIHGALHLCGHDHQNDAEAQRMEQLEIELLRSLRIANPYQSRHIESTP